MDWSLIWSCLTSWYPKYENVLSHIFDRLRYNYRKRFNLVHEIQNLFLNFIQILNVNSNRRKHRSTLILFNSNHDISTTPIVHIISKSTNRMDHILRIPSLLEVNPFPLNDLSVQQLINTYW